MLVNEHTLIQRGLTVLETEARTLHELGQKLNHTFAKACQSFLSCKGRIVVSGMGKSGHIGKKIAATLASTGTPALFLHPAEASHGDLGMITKQDSVLLLSNSGETQEILTLLPFIKRLGIEIISLTGNPHSSLAKLSQFHLDVSVKEEACPLGLAPTASTAAMLAMGDALALAVSEAKGFTAEDFAKSHPGGRLGKRLLLKIKDLMHTDSDIPRTSVNALLIDAVMEMTEKRLGFTTIVEPDSPDTLKGILTDGDLRRVLQKGLDIHSTAIATVMNPNFTTISEDMLAIEALPLMEKLKILVLPVVDADKKLVGALNMHDFFKAGLL